MVEEKIIITMAEGGKNFIEIIDELDLKDKCKEVRKILWNYYKPAETFRTDHNIRRIIVLTNDAILSKAEEMSMNQKIPNINSFSKKDINENEFIRLLWFARFYYIKEMKIGKSVIKHTDIISLTPLAYSVRREDLN